MNLGYNSKSKQKMMTYVERGSCNRKCKKDDGSSGSSSSSMELGAELLHAARVVRGGDGLLRILEQDPRTLIHVTDPVGDTVLHVVARAGDLEVAKQLDGFLKEHGLEEVLMEQNSQGDTPLHLAVANRHQNVACLFFAACKLAGFGFRLNNGESGLLYGKSVSSRICVISSDIEMELVYRALHELRDPQPTPAAAQELILAIRKGQQDVVLAALKKHQDLEGCNMGSFLHVAAECGQVGMLRLLVTQMTPPDKPTCSLTLEGNSEGNTPLHVALLNNHKDAAQYLIEFEPRAAYQGNQEGVSPLHLALEGAYEDVVKLIFQMMPMPTRGIDQASLVTAAIRARNLGILKLLLGQMTWDETARVMLEGDSDGYTPLHFALDKYIYNKDVARFLIELEPRAAYQVDKSGVSPLYLAIQGRYKDQVEYVFQRVPFVTISPSVRGSLLTPGSASIVYAAIEASSLGILKLLVGQMASDEAASLMLAGNDEGNTPLHIALEGKRKDIASYLIELAPKAVYEVNNSGFSPLHLAVKSGYKDIVKYIFKTIPGASISSSTRESLHTSRKALLGHLAITKKNLRILESVMEELPELIDILDYKGWRVLSYAAYKGYLDGVRYLLTNFPSSVKKYDRDGSLPVHKAVGGGHVRIVKEFLLHCPETMYDIDKKGQSILHFAVKCTKVDVLSYITKETTEAKEIFDLKDSEGKTFIDLAIIDLANKLQGASHSKGMFISE